MMCVAHLSNITANQPATISAAITTRLNAMENAGQPTNHAVIHLPSTAQLNITLVWNTAAVNMMKNAVIRDTNVFLMMPSAVITERRNAMENVFQMVMSAAHMVPPIVTTLDIVKNTAVMSQMDITGVNILKNVILTAVNTTIVKLLKNVSVTLNTAAHTEQSIAHTLTNAKNTVANTIITTTKFGVTSSMPALMNASAAMMDTKLANA